MRALLAAVLTAFAVSAEGCQIEPAFARVKDDRVITQQGPTVRLDFGKGHCSGFYIGADTIVTAGHCVDEDILSRFDVVGEYGIKVTTAHAVLFAKDEDVGILKTNSTKPALDPIKVDCSPVKIGQEIIVVGWPADLGFVQTYGHIAGLPQRNADDTWASAMLLDVKADGGNSGGPVIDAQTGKAVGILVGWTHPRDDTYHWGVPSTVLCKFLGALQ